MVVLKMGWPSYSTVEPLRRQTIDGYDSLSMDKAALTWISAVTNIDKGKGFAGYQIPIDMSQQSGYLPALWIDRIRG
jgi:hypothetical protein